MNGSVHSAYYQVLDELVPARTRTSKNDNDTDIDAIINKKKPQSWHIRISSSAIKYTLTFIGIIILGFVFYSYETEIDSLQTRFLEIESKLETLKTEVRQSESTKGEIDLMKKILTGLVATINDIETKQRTKPASDIEETKDRVQVISSNTSLKDSPSKTAKSLTSIDKETVLLVKKKEGDWYLVETPLGKSAWINASEVRLLGD